MSFITLRTYSEALKMQANVQVILPQTSTLGEIGTENGARESETKCLYLLHGLSDDESVWARRTSIERYATKYGLCVVMPCGGRSFYSNEKSGLNYYTYIAKELPKIIEDTFRVSKRTEDRYIGGNSMGGYGALKIALTERGRYAAAFGLSSVANIHNPIFTDTLQRVFGERIPDEADLKKLIALREEEERKPRLYMTIGKDDFMYEDNLAFDRYMQGKKYDYTFVQTEGQHCWDLWDSTVQSAIEWMLK